MIGGKVLDASAVAAIARYDLAAGAWLDTAKTLNIALYLPTLALTEVRAVLPGSADEHIGGTGAGTGRGAMLSG